MKKFETKVTVGSNSCWDGEYQVYSDENYKDAFGGGINGMDDRYLEIPCNKPWVLITCETCDSTYTMQITHFDGVEIHTYEYEERTYFTNTVTDICYDFIHGNLNVTPETIADIIEALDASLVYVDRESDEDECSDSDFSEHSDSDSSEDSDSDSSEDLDIILDEDVDMDDESDME